MKPDNWTQQLRDKLDDYELPPPDDLWADIEAALPQSPDPARVRRISLRRWLVAASVVGLLFGGAYLWWSSRPAPTPRSVAIGSPAAKAPIASVSPTAEPTQPLPTSQEEGKPQAEVGAMPPSSPSNPLLAEEKAQTPPLTPPLEGRGAAVPEQSPLFSTTSTPEISTPLAGLEVIVPVGSPTGSDVLSTPLVGLEAIVPVGSPTGSDVLSTPPTASPKSHPSLTLYAMNAFSDQNAANGLHLGGPLAQQYLTTYLNSYGSTARLDEPLWLSGYEEQQHHYRPLAFGLTLAYPLSPRLSVTTSIVYTKLRSDFTQVMRTQQIHQEQTLHYLGLPLGLSYCLWRQNRLNAYASGALKADWNIATRMVTEGTNQQLPKDRLQWSVAASLGVQYDLLPKLALYLESALNYYPDNHSHLQNYFKEKPLNLNLQLGLCITPTR